MVKLPGMDSIIPATEGHSSIQAMLNTWCPQCAKICLSKQCGVKMYKNCPHGILTIPVSHPATSLNIRSYLSKIFTFKFHLNLHVLFFFEVRFLFPKNFHFYLLGSENLR